MNSTLFITRLAVTFGWFAVFGLFTASITTSWLSVSIASAVGLIFGYWMSLKEK